MRGINSFGSPDYTGKRASLERTPPRQEVLNDLRANEVPYRSDEMLVAMEGAIDLYQRIASKGGWQPIPGDRMMRAGDGDERVPYLRRRLMVTGELPRSSNTSDYISTPASRLRSCAIRSAMACVPRGASTSRRWLLST